jgi:hypothetical protein
MASVLSWLCAIRTFAEENQVSAKTRAERERKSRIVSCTVTETEYDLLQRIAEEEDRTASAILRRGLLLVTATAGEQRDRHQAERDR